MRGTARDNTQAHRVIPVLLEKPTSDLSGVPYGTGILQAMDGTRPGGLERVAQELAERLDEWQRATLPSEPISVVEYHAFGAALRLDRSPQWGAVLEESHKPGHVLFLLHGPRHENVGLFIERIQHFFSQEAKQPHAIYRIPLKHEGVSARCGHDWQRHLRFVLGGESDAHQLLAQAARQQAVFLILGLQPLDLAVLDEDIRLGLREFLVQRLPNLLAQAKARNSVHILLALDYAEDLPSHGAIPIPIERADSWGQEAAASGQLRYCPLPPAELPPWHDVALYLSKKEPRPSAATVDRLRAEYERLTSGQRISYRELTDMIDRYLAEA
jgi:hypothetical protein